MKHILVVCLMLFTVSAFASNSVSKEEIKSKTISSLEIVEKESINKENIDAYGWYATCYVTIRNTETGETRRVHSIGYGATQSAALSNCGSNAMTLAQAMVDSLNDN